MGQSIIVNTGVLISFVIMLSQTAAFQCYERAQNGTVNTPNCVDCRYCSIVEKMYPAPQGQRKDISMFPVPPEMGDYSALSTLFKSEEDIYEVLSVCVLEKYAVAGTTEILMRCMCDTPLCNQAKGVTQHLNKQIRKATAKPVEQPVWEF